MSIFLFLALTRFLDSVEHCTFLHMLSCLYDLWQFCSFYHLCDFFSFLYWLDPPVRCWIVVVRVDIQALSLKHGSNSRGTTKCWWGCGTTGTWRVSGGGINGAAALKGSSLFSDKLDTHPPCDSAIALLGIYPRKNKIHPYGKTRALCLTPNSQNWKQPSAWEWAE